MLKQQPLSNSYLFRRSPLAFKNVSSFLLLPFAVCLLISCAQQSNMMTGGAKDETPPEVISAIPPNFSTRFKSEKIEITFDEYFVLKDITKQLVVSPPMNKKPEFKIKGKSLDISFKDSLQPDRTYAINFGDALQDLNEGNPIKNFQFVFSTGDNIDSLQVSGRVIMVPANKPAEDILVMLYSGTADSLPLKTIPLYISRTDKEGKFTLRNLAGGSYKIFALKDGNTNYRFDVPTEAVAFSDSLITPSVALAPVPDTAKPARDSLNPVRDSVSKPKKDLSKAKNKIKAVKDKVKPVKDTTNQVQQPADTLQPKSKYIFKPDNIELHLFTEVRPNQYLSGSDRIRRDQIRLKFNEKIDSLNLEFLNLPKDSIAVSLEWSGDPDTLDFWILNKSMATLDSLSAILRFPAYDSVERPTTKTDTVRLRYRAVPKPASAPKNEFFVSVSVEKNKSLDFGQPLVFTTSLPYVQMDTSLIRLVSGKDSAARKVPYTLIPDTLKGFVLNGFPIIQPHPRIVTLNAGFAADTSYRLVLLPGAFKGIEGQKNDSVDIRFKMKNRDQYGTIKIALPDLKGPAIVQMMDPRGKVFATKLMTGVGTATFDLLPPGKYTVQLVFDTNSNGRWDTGRYKYHIQPEKVITFSKELNLKANWEVSETWQWEDK
jgi:uncharacterized protein (DUF2141 family)